MARPRPCACRLCTVHECSAVRLGLGKTELRHRLLTLGPPRATSECGCQPQLPRAAAPDAPHSHSSHPLFAPPLHSHYSHPLVAHQVPKGTAPFAIPHARGESAKRSRHCRPSCPAARTCSSRPLSLPLFAPRRLAPAPASLPQADGFLPHCGGPCPRPLARRRCQGWRAVGLAAACQRRHRRSRWTLRLRFEGGRRHSEVAVHWSEPARPRHSQVKAHVRQRAGRSLIVGVNMAKTLRRLNFSPTWLASQSTRQRQRLPTALRVHAVQCTNPRHPPQTSFGKALHSQ